MRVRDVVGFEGQFPSWEAFDLARRAHCEKTHTMYVCRNTVKVDVANRRRKMQVPASWQYDRKVFVCTHGYRRTSRSSGSRPRQNVRYTNCPARFTAAVACDTINGKDVLCIKIVNQHAEHDDHPVTLEQWRNYSQNRASIKSHPYLAHEAELLRRVGSNKRAARQHLEMISGRVCTMKDMHNLYAQLKKKDRPMQRTTLPITGNASSSSTSAGVVTGTTASAMSSSMRSDPGRHLHGSEVTVSAEPHADMNVESVLQQFVDADVENHVSILSADDGSNEAICLASKCMKEHFQVFPELCLLDVVGCGVTTEMGGSGGSGGIHANSYGADQSLCGFMAMDALGHSKPVFLAETRHTSAPLLRRISQDFKRTHPRWTDMKLIVMDKLLPGVVDVLREEFPTVRVLLCQFHVIKYFSSMVTEYEYEIANHDTQEQVRELLKELVFAHNEHYYDGVKVLLLEQLDHRTDHPLMRHLESYWEPYRRLWVSYWRLRSLEFSSFFSKGFQPFWNPLKSIFERAGRIPTGQEISTATTQLQSSLPPLPLTSSLLMLPPQSPTTHAVPSAMQDRDPIEHDVSFANEATGNASHTAVVPDASSSSIAKCMSEVLTMIKFIEEEWTSKMLMMEMTKPVTEFSAGSVLHFLVNCLSSFGVALVSTQLVTANTGIGGSVSIIKGRAAMMHVTARNNRDVQPSAEDALAAEGTVVYVDKVKKKKHVMRRDCSGCDCEFYVVYQMPCQHLIWYEISYLHHRQLSMSAVGQRWFLRTFQIPKLISQKESNEVREKRSVNPSYGIMFPRE